MIKLKIEKKLHGPDGVMNFDVSLWIPGGTFCAVTGDSGSGKTSLLRMIAGLTRPEGGSIVVNGETWFDSSLKINLHAKKRSTGFVFQDFALFPSMTVKENIAYASGRRSEVDELIGIMELGELEKRYPEKLSSGQKQRVALARALARKPSILLLDEPLSALDSGLRYRLQDELVRAHRSFGCTIILVSHDIPGILNMADRIICLENGRITNDLNTASLRGREKIPDYYTLLKNHDRRMI